MKYSLLSYYTTKKFMLSEQSEDCMGLWIREQYHMYQNMNGIEFKILCEMVSVNIK